MGAFGRRLRVRPASDAPARPALGFPSEFGVGRCAPLVFLREHGAVPLSEDEQRVLDEIERQLQVGEPRPEGLRSRHLEPRQPSSPTPLLILAALGGFASVVVGVLLGGVFGVIVSLVGFVAIVIAGAALLRGSRAAIAAQVAEIAQRYQVPPR